MFRNQAQAKRLLRAIRQKARKMTFEWGGSLTVMTTQDLLAIEKIVSKCEKRLK